jgi:hypothetical protein
MFTTLTIAMTLSGVAAVELPATKAEASRPAIVQLAARREQFFSVELAEPPKKKVFGNPKGSNGPAPFGNGKGSNAKPTGYSTGKPQGYTTGTPSTAPAGYANGVGSNKPVGYPTGAPQGYTGTPSSGPTGYGNGVGSNGKPTGYPTGKPQGYATGGAPTIGPAPQGYATGQGYQGNQGVIQPPPGNDAPPNNGQLNLDRLKQLEEKKG